jgi:gluconolactonase
MATDATWCSPTFPMTRSCGEMRSPVSSPPCVSPSVTPPATCATARGGRLSCALGSRTLTRAEHDGTVTVLAASFEGTRLTGPNGVMVKSNRSIWFSDNGAGIRGNYLGEKAEQEWPFRVYRLDPVTGVLSIAIDDMERPNGLCFSPDETRLYVVDTPGGAKITHVYDIVDGKTVNGRLFFDAMPGYADGIRCDTEGNVWCGFSDGPGQDGVAVFAPDGALLGACCCRNAVPTSAAAAANGTACS